MIGVIPKQIGVVQIVLARGEVDSVSAGRCAEVKPPVLVCHGTIGFRTTANGDAHPGHVSATGLSNDPAPNFAIQTRMRNILDQLDGIVRLTQRRRIGAIVDLEAPLLAGGKKKVRLTFFEGKPPA